MVSFLDSALAALGVVFGECRIFQGKCMLMGIHKGNNQVSSPGFSASYMQQPGHSPPLS